MNVVVEVRSRGADSKLYREHQLDQEALTRLRLLEHELRCGQGLSVRQVQAELAAEHGVRRSIGIIQRDLRLWSCEHCQDGGDVSA